MTVSLCTLCIGAAINDFNCGGACNGTYVGNPIQCLCNTSKAPLTWNITTSNGYIRCDFHAGSESCTNCMCNSCIDDDCQRFQFSYNNTMNISTVSFIENKTGDIDVMCLNGQGPSKESCTIKVSGIVKLSVIYSLHIGTLT